MDYLLKHSFTLFSVYGVELEYMIVDRETLNIYPITDRLFYHLAGEWCQEVDRGALFLNNELALHVLEIKVAEPIPNLEKLPAVLQKELKLLNKELRNFNAMLMPTAMHPWVECSKEFRLWPHGDMKIYSKYHEMFDCARHGWANLQSSHLNLPFKDEKEFVRLHAAIRLILPLIPALSASSPYADAAYTGFKDFRVHTYRNNSSMIFSICGFVIPEVVHSFEEYKRVVLQPIYHDLASYDPEGILCHEWVNSRGAITRFERNAIEIRLIDIQETHHIWNRLFCKCKRCTVFPSKSILSIYRIPLFTH